jgi:succinate dehydrogenase flavin-adding protein (antitoxin of CptAB toxin-antitoxin module)
MQKAVANMALIQQLFQASAITASETTDDATLIALLEQNDKTFISIAYEASAMERALLRFYMRMISHYRTGKPFCNRLRSIVHKFILAWAGR